MRIKRQVNFAIAWVALACCTPASAQKVTTVEDLTLSQALVQLTGPLGSRPVGEAIAFTSALEIATEPLGISSGGFVFKLDPATGLLVRTATTFGPAFADRAITSGQGQVNVGANFRASTYNKLNDLSLASLAIGSAAAPSSSVARTGTANLALTSRTLILSGAVGVTDNLDIGVAIPMVSVKLIGTSSLRSADGVNIRLAEGGGTFAGLGDIAALAKYRFVRFGSELADAGGVAVAINMRMPTGDRANLRGLGITRTLVSFVGSGRMGRLQPHVNGGFEFWSKGIAVATGPNTSVEARHRAQYAAGVELEATPKLTLIVDFLGQQVLGAGQIGVVSDTPALNPTGVTSTQSLVALGEGIQRLSLVPGLKLNLKGKLLLSLSAIVTLKNSGLRSTVTPVVGIDLTL
jgi:hypothetical protein